MSGTSPPTTPWPPTKYLDFVEALPTNSSPAIVRTDAGLAYLKPLHPKINPHDLAVEWVCTKLAEWFGLPVLDHCILTLGKSDLFNAADGREVMPGPTFATRAVQAQSWDGTAKSIGAIVNAHDLARLVVFDTWVRNPDRFPPVDETGKRQSTWPPNRGNVLLIRDPPEAERLRLVAMDFGQAIVQGHGLSSKSYGLPAAQDEWVYGLFPEFRSHITQALVDRAAAALGAVERDRVDGFIAGIPPEWDVSATARTHLSEHLYRRAGYVSDSISARLAPLCYPQGQLGTSEPGTGA